MCALSPNAERRSNRTTERQHRLPLHRAGRCWRAQGFPSQEHTLRSGLLLIRARPCRADGQLHLLMNLNLMRSKMPGRNCTQSGADHTPSLPPVLHGHSSVSRQPWSPLPTGQRLYPHSSETRSCLWAGVLTPGHSFAIKPLHALGVSRMSREETPRKGWTLTVPLVFFHLWGKPVSDKLWVPKVLTGPVRPTAVEQPL